MTLILQTIENLRNRTNVELVHTEERFTKLMSKPSVDSIQRFNEDLVAVVADKVETQQTHLCRNGHT